MITRTVIELSIFSGSLSLFLDFCFREGHIFAWWLDFWAEVFIDEPIRKAKVPKGIDLRDYKFAQVDNPLFKPLGYCVVCMNIWLSFLVSIAGCFTWNISLVQGLFIILLSSLFVRLLHGRLL